MVVTYGLIFFIAIIENSNMDKMLIFAAVATAGMAATPGAQAALAADAQLLMDPQTFTCPYGLGTPPACLTGAPVPQSNYFAMDINGDGIWADTERVALVSGSDGGIVLGTVQTGSVIDSWGFFGHTGYSTQAGTLSIASDDGNGNVKINMSGWYLMWGAPQDPVDMGTGADAIVTCAVDCAAGDSFTLDYQAIVASGDFAGVAYQLHMSGNSR